MSPYPTEADNAVGVLYPVALLAGWAAGVLETTSVVHRQSRANLPNLAAAAA